MLWRSLQDLPVEVVMINLTCGCSLPHCEGSIMFVRKSSRFRGLASFIVGGS